MLYFDSSALVKRYLSEDGSEAVRRRFGSQERIFTSWLSYAEVLAVFGRKVQAGDIRREEFETLQNQLMSDWQSSLVVLEVNGRVLSNLPELVIRYPLKGADAIQLSAALWLRNTCALTPDFAQGDLHLEFWVADQSLARIAAQCGLSVFNPESAS